MKTCTESRQTYHGVVLLQLLITMAVLCLRKTDCRWHHDSDSHFYCLRPHGEVTETDCHWHHVISWFCTAVKTYAIWTYVKNWDYEKRKIQGTNVTAQIGKINKFWIKWFLTKKLIIKIVVLAFVTFSHCMHIASNKYAQRARPKSVIAQLITDGRARCAPDYTFIRPYIALYGRIKVSISMPLKVCAWGTMGN